METNEQRVLVLGLPETGKSSFIQSLDEVLKHPTTSRDLCLSGLAEDRSYLQRDKAKFLAGEVLSRTDRQRHDTSVELWFEHPPTGARGRLQLPDEKGEVFRDQWVDRRWERRYRESLAGFAGAFLFVRADEKSQNDELLGVNANGVVESSEPPRPWDMKEASAQVQLTDILQFIAEHDEAPRPLRIAVLISAWDTVGHDGDIRHRNPEKFLDREWAMLAQYLRANPESFVRKIFGVSAYGGKPGQLGQLLEQPPHERVKLTEGTETSCDLARPLRWLLKLD